MGKILSTVTENVNSETNEGVWWTLIAVGVACLVLAVFGAGYLVGRH